MNILGFEDKYTEELEVALLNLFPEAYINVNNLYSSIPMKHGVDYDFVVTSMRLQSDLRTSARKENCGLAVMTYYRQKNIPAVCMSSYHHNDQEISFADHVLRQKSLRILHTVNKTSVQGWVHGLQESFASQSQHDYWTKRPRTGIRSAIQEWIPQ